MAQVRFDSSKDHETKPSDAPGTMSCRWCGGLTDRIALSTLGGRCSACYAAYCAEPIKDRVGPDPRAVKRALARQQGQRIAPETPVQDVLARQRLSKARVREYALEMGLDIPDDDRQPSVSEPAQDARP